MEKLVKKEDNPKAAKKKEARKRDALAEISEQLERTFTKKMKALVKEVKKETKKEIKDILKEARLKIRTGAAEIAEDLLKTTESETTEIEKPENNVGAIAPDPIATTPSETADSTQSTTITSPQKATSRSKKTVISTDIKSKPSARTRTRKTSDNEMKTTENTET